MTTLTMCSGAEGAACEAYPIVGDSIMRCLRRWYNNDLENIGEPDRYATCLQIPAHLSALSGMGAFGRKPPPRELPTYHTGLTG